ncbi:YidH family protein [Nocardia sp. NPDC003963]
MRRSPAPAEHEPDYRFTLANERTFLAWIRTALGLLAGGVAVDHLAARSQDSGTFNPLVLACVLFAVVLAVGAFVQWSAVRRAMRRDLPLPASTLVPVLALGVGGIAVIVTLTTLSS